MLTDVISDAGRLGDIHPHLLMFTKPDGSRWGMLVHTASDKDAGLAEAAAEGSVVRAVVAIEPNPSSDAVLGALSGYRR